MKAPLPPLAGLDYESCTLKELQLFFKQRSGKELPTHERHDKGFVIRCLRLLDDSFTFRFMDLAGELRNVIYEELLLNKKQRSARVYPEILRVSKLCHTEGQGILKRECLPIRVVKISGVGDCYKAQLDAKTPSNTLFHTKRLSRQLGTWLHTSITTARVVTIDVDLNTTDKLHLNTTLYNLTTIFSKTSPSIVFLRAAANLSATRYTQRESKRHLVCLSPLAHLSKHTQLKFKGIPKDIQEKLSRVSQNSKSGTPLATCFDAQIKVWDVEELLEQAGLDPKEATTRLAKWEKTKPRTSDSAMIDMLGNGAERSGYSATQRRLQRYLGELMPLKQQALAILKSRNEAQA